MIVEALGAVDQVERRRDIYRLHLLVLFHRRPVFHHVGVVAEGQVACTKIHGRGDTEGEIGAQSGLAQHTHMKTGIEAVLIARYHLLSRCSLLFIDNRLRPHILELNVLEVGAHQHAEVERSEVGVGSVFYFSFLRLCLFHEETGQRYDDICDGFLHFFF